MKKTSASLLLLLLLSCTTKTKAQGIYAIAHAVDSIYPNDTMEDGPKAKVRRIFKKWETI